MFCLLLHHMYNLYLVMLMFFASVFPLEYWCMLKWILCTSPSSQAMLCIVDFLQTFCNVIFISHFSTAHQYL